MQANGIVTAVNVDGTVEIIVKRGAACGHGCLTCGSCGVSTITLNAYNNCNALVGDAVVVQTPTKSILGMAAWLYVLPIALFLGGYAVAPWVGAVAFVVTLGAAILCGRRRKHGATTIEMITSE
ncbi:MAG: SoxR reducing system RseC family protein [Oscillospiraceae bacterium]|nr:SoxR reducing system RseC family protein [Oscillospiraceae bacterium]